MAPRWPETFVKVYIYFQLDSGMWGYLPSNEILYCGSLWQHYKIFTKLGKKKIRKGWSRLNSLSICRNMTSWKVTIGWLVAMALMSLWHHESWWHSVCKQIPTNDCRSTYHKITRAFPRILRAQQINHQADFKRTKMQILRVVFHQISARRVLIEAAVCGVFLTLVHQQNVAAIAFLWRN